ncbi:hypothetical protein JCM9279_004955 [Rhodotorula babjevae]
MAALRLQPSESCFFIEDPYACNAFATLAFGITVSVLDLCIAGSASASQRPTMLGINLILARKNALREEDRLKTSVEDGKVDVCALPVEIWELIKEKLMSLSYADEFRRWELHYHPEVATDEYWTRDKRERDEQPLTLRSILLPEDSRTWHRFIEPGGVGNFVFLHDQGELVALPLVADDRTFYPSVQTQIDRDQIVPYDSLRFSRVSSSAFVLPSGARSRFRRLLASFPALAPRPVSMTISTIRSPDEDAAAAAAVDAGKDEPGEGNAGARSEASEQEDRRARERAERERASEPEWMLCAGALAHL